MTSIKVIAERWRQWQPTMHVETLALLGSLFFTVSSNSLFWKSMLAGRSFAQSDAWLFAVGVGVTMVALHFFMFALVFNRWTA